MFPVFTDNDLNDLTHMVVKFMRTFGLEPDMDDLFIINTSLEDLLHQFGIIAEANE